MARAGITRSSVKSSLSAGVVGSHLMAGGWGVVLVGWTIAVVSGMRHFVSELTSTLLVMGFLGGTLWVAGSMSQAMGWLGLRVARGGNARAVAAFEVMLGASYLLVPLLGFWGLPFLWLPAYIAVCVWHAVAAAWFFARADGPAARVARVAHLAASLGLFLVLAFAEGASPLPLAIALAVGAVAALVAHLATARYMARARPWVEASEAFD